MWRREYAVQVAARRDLDAAEPDRTARLKAVAGSKESGPLPGHLTVRWSPRRRPDPIPIFLGSCAPGAEIGRLPLSVAQEPFAARFLGGADGFAAELTSSGASPSVRLTAAPDCPRGPFHLSLALVGPVEEILQVWQVAGAIREQDTPMNSPLELLPRTSNDEVNQ